ncbi:MAG: transposase [Chitinophagales bacterium]
MSLYRNKYRIESARLKGWDYSNNGMYFITICTHHKLHFFGNIVNDIMLLNDIGKVAHQFWEDIPKYSPFIELGVFVVMPNHTHGILIIDKENNDWRDKEPMLEIEYDPNNAKEFMSKISPKSGTISRILSSYKAAVTKQARKIHPDYGWQERFHEHIIRNEESFKRIENYILTNPENWEKDKFYG